MLRICSVVKTSDHLDFIISTPLATQFVFIYHYLTRLWIEIGERACPTQNDINLHQIVVFSKHEPILFEINRLCPPLRQIHLVIFQIVEIGVILGRNKIKLRFLQGDVKVSISCQLSITSNIVYCSKQS